MEYWNIGVLEYWSVGVLDDGILSQFSIVQDSITPSLRGRDFREFSVTEKLPFQSLQFRKELSDDDTRMESG